jgi:hypothetical protein
VSADGLTEEEYYAAVTRLGLRPKTKTTFVDASGEARNVPLASEQTPVQRVETIAMIKLLMGVAWQQN